MFPIDHTQYDPVVFDPQQKEMTAAQRTQLQMNIALVRDIIVFFTGYANARGLGGHTGGAYDIVPEALIADGFMRGSDLLLPILFDEAGHRVALQYCLAALDTQIRRFNIDDLLHYREFNFGLPGHPEREDGRGIYFSSGRLGHLFGYANGVAEANPRMKVVLLGSDGSQQEGSDAEAARYAVARKLGIILLIDDNDITIEARTSEYLPGFDVAQTLEGHGMVTDTGDGENLDGLFGRFARALAADRPVALINKRPMAPGVEGIEDSTKGHDAVPPELAVRYLRKRGHIAAADMIESAEKSDGRGEYRGSSKEFAKNRSQFGTILCDILDGLNEEERNNVLVVSADLGGSTGVNAVKDRYPEIYRSGGVMERNGVSVAAGFGATSCRQGIFATFSAFAEMVISEISMARLNDANVLFHFSHSGVDDMADNTCHFGINNFFVDSGLPENDTTRLYFPADPLQLRAVLERAFRDPGLRFVFSTRSAVPFMQTEDGEKYFDPGSGYIFEPGKDEIIRNGTAGFVVSYGEMLYRALDAVERLKDDGVDVGLINKPTLNVPDEAMLDNIGDAPFVLVVESQNRHTGLGVRFGTWLLERGKAPRYDHLGTVRPGAGGLSEQIGYQGLDPDAIIEKVRAMSGDPEL